ncbi:sigma factor G inhibitor Gin [Desulfotruncus alcoholivorax]|uniref:sigma factor G inhibitor Gin n=1 Tax=Desulfotruncus alcoholivorax TaxID=265477 RepID=UPI0009D6CECA|nr:sigma factor G inhibitor Gin [Desulfotruncus alcoholivorax]
MNCIFCGEKTVADGLWVLGSHICALCESKIVTIDAGDANYDFYKSGLKKMWRCAGACSPSAETILASLARR